MQVDYLSTMKLSFSRSLAFSLLLGSYRVTSHRSFRKILAVQSEQNSMDHGFSDSPLVDDNQDGGESTELV